MILVLEIVIFQHFLFLRALNPGILIYGDTTNKLECTLGLLDSLSNIQLPLPRSMRSWLDYIFSLKELKISKFESDHKINNGAESVTIGSSLDLDQNLVVHRKCFQGGL
jgi:hypothetical protein